MHHPLHINVHLKFWRFAEKQSTYRIWPKYILRMAYTQWPSTDVPARYLVKKWPFLKEMVRYRLRVLVVASNYHFLAPPLLSPVLSLPCHLKWCDKCDTHDKSCYSTRQQLHNYIIYLVENVESHLAKKLHIHQEKKIRSHRLFHQHLLMTRA